MSLPQGTMFAKLP